MSNLQEEEKIIRELKSLPHTHFYQSGEIYEIRRVTKIKNIRLLLQVEFEEISDSENLWINYIWIRAKAKDIKVDIIQYNTEDHYILIRSEKEKFERDVEDSDGELLYFENFYDVSDVFNNIEEFTKDKITEFLNIYSDEISESLMKKIQNLLSQI